LTDIVTENDKDVRALLLLLLRLRRWDCYS
jgi:hypothetical protein